MYLFFLVILFDLIFKLKKPTVLRNWCSIQIWSFWLNWISLELRKREFSYFDFTHTHSSGHKQRNNQQRQLSIILWRVKACVDSTVVTCRLSAARYHSRSFNSHFGNISNSVAVNKRTRRNCHLSNRARVAQYQALLLLHQRHRWMWRKRELCWPNGTIPKPVKALST